MNRNEFAEKITHRYLNESDIDYMDSTIGRALSSSTVSKYYTITVEELAEIQKEISDLQQKITKKMRGNEIGILEEMSDVIICMRYLQKICDIDDETLAKSIAIKLDRLNDKLDKDGVYL